MAPNLREKRTPSARAVASQPQTASKTANATRTSSQQPSTARSKSQPKTVPVRSRGTQQSRKKTPAPAPDDASTESEDSPSQGREKSSRPPPSAQQPATGDASDEVSEDSIHPTDEDLLDIDTHLLHEIYVGKEWQVTVAENIDEVDWKYRVANIQAALDSKFKGKAKIHPPPWGPTGLILAGKKEKKQKWKRTLLGVYKYDKPLLFSLRPMLQEWWRLHHDLKFAIGDIDMVVRWEWTKEDLVDEDSSSEMTGEEQVEEDSTQRRRRKDSKKRKRRDSKPAGTQGGGSSSQKQRISNVGLQQIEAMVGDNLLELNRQYQCKVSSCRNYPKPCVVIPGLEQHLFLNTSAVKKWNQLIRDGDATVRECPASVVGDLLQEQRRNEVRKTGKTANVGFPGSGININLGGPWGAAPALAPNDELEIPQSSPPERTGDDDVNTIRYMKWLVKQYPNQYLELNRISKTLTDNGWGFSDLRRITKDEWKDMRVGPGFVKKIRTSQNMKKWLKNWRSSDEEEEEGIEFHD